MVNLPAIGRALRPVLDEPAVFLGLVALVGLLLQRKPAVELIQGTLHTVIGFIIFQSGAGLLVGGLEPIAEMVQQGWGVTGVYPFNEPAFYKMMEIMAHTIVPTFILGWLLHILFVKVLRRWFRCVFLTAHVMAFTATLFNLGIEATLGLKGTTLVLASALCCAVFWTVMPQWTYGYSKQFVGDRFTLGHHMHLGAALAAEIGKRLGPSQDADQLKLPGSLSMFQDPTINSSVTMPIFFFIVGMLSGLPAVSGLSQGAPWWLYLLMQGLQVSAGLIVLILGVEGFLEAIVPAFKGFSQTILPGAVPALDMPVFFPSSPMGTLLGFVGGSAGMLLVSVLLLLWRAPVFVFPNLLLAFFECGAEGVFANKFGGWKAAIVGGAVGGILFSSSVLLLQPLTPQLAGEGVQFGNIDAGLVLAPLFWIFRFVGSLLGVGRSLG
jgi:PTS system ascorbate-specific IIC component